MKYLVTYSNYLRAKDAGHPPVGTEIEAISINDFEELTERFAEKIILYKDGETPITVQNLVDYGWDSPEENAENHIVSALPENWREMRWIEVYNGYRE